MRFNTAGGEQDNFREVQIVPGFGPIGHVGLPPFQKMAKVPRLFRDIIVTEKIDGTNASVYIDDTGRVQAASRTRWITPKTDNFGFAKWVEQNEYELRRVLGVGHHFGEWYGAGIQRGYGLSGKKFALFNVQRWAHPRNQQYIEEGVLTWDKLTNIAWTVPGLDVVTITGAGEFNTEDIQRNAANLLVAGSQQEPGFDRPEGIVVYHSHSDALFKYTFEKNDGHKGT